MICFLKKITNFLFVSIEGIEQIKGIRVACSMMKKLCNYGGVSRAFAVRELLEGAIFRLPSLLFGAIPPIGSNIIQSHLSLMDDNC